MELSDINDNVLRDEKTHYELSREYAKMGVNESTGKVIELSQNPPDSKATAVIFAARALIAGGKSYAKSAYHAGMGFTEEMMIQNPNDGRILNNMMIAQAIEQGRNQENFEYRSMENKGIESFREKMVENQGKSILQNENKGINSFHNRMNENSIETSIEKSEQEKSNVNGQSR